MNFTFNYEENDVYRFNLDLHNSTSKEKGYLQQRSGASLYFFGLLCLYAYVLDVKIMNYLWLLIVIAIVHFFFTPYDQKQRIKRSVASFSKDSRNKKLFGETEIVLDQRGLLEKTPIEETFIKWEHIHEVKEADYAYYFFYASNRAFVLPKSAVSNSEELKAFLDSVSVPLVKM
ncbi:YcxB family protein [Gottfriedia acidiceleris]|uniref:YcxB family protein n=1 Tax=Gottfriedia acidiceleris TaxID=371036 RepID=UPI002FFEB689